jgi:hypothetical protein
MTSTDKAQPQSAPGSKRALDPQAIPDVTIQFGPASSSGPPPAAAPGNDEHERLQKILPEINEVAQKVGGFKKLAEIAENLHQAGGAS